MFVCARLSLSLYRYMEAGFVSFIGNNGLDKWSKLHREFVRIQFQEKEERRLCIFGILKNLEFDGIASKCPPWRSNSTTTNDELINCKLYELSLILNYLLKKKK